MSLRPTGREFLRNPDPAEPADWPPWPQAGSGGRKSIDHTSRCRLALVSQTCCHRSGETGIQTQGTREGTPVFRIGGCRRCNHASTQCPFGRCPAVQGDVLRTPQFDHHGLQTELGEFICLTAQTAFVAAQAAPATVQPVSMIDSVPTRERNCQSAPWLVE